MPIATNTPAEACTRGESRYYFVNSSLVSARHSRKFRCCSLPGMADNCHRLLLHFEPKAVPNYNNRRASQGGGHGRGGNPLGVRATGQYADIPDEAERVSPEEY
ncbi:hypothetical protein FAVG1_02901 [Fusarium avenaceum]|nr:hypothetical protein FAVG1_02901 [Fusarium avenaceum]